MKRINRLRVVTAITLPLCISGAYIPSLAFASETKDASLVVELEATGASVADASSLAKETVVGKSDEGETIQIVHVNDQDALVTVQYAPSMDASNASNNTASIPKPEVTTINGNVFTSGNFGDAVDRHTPLEAAPEFASAITSDSASFDWDTPPGGEYSVLRDGDTRGTSSNGRFTDTGLKPGDSYDYVLEGKADAQGNVASRAMTVSALSADTNHSDQIVYPLRYQPSTTAYDYKTFIPDATVSNFEAKVGCGLGDGESFKGDNRDFIGPGAGAPYETSSYRTQMFFNVNWDNTEPYDLAYVKSVGPTRKLNSKGDVIETRTASDAGMVFQNPTRSGDLVTFGVSHEVGDPFCLAGAIRYSLTWVKIYRSGSVSIQGSRQPVPSHEAYARLSNSDGSESWKTLYQGTGTNFLCLLPGVCPSENIDETVSG